MKEGRGREGGWKTSYEVERSERRTGSEREGGVLGWKGRSWREVGDGWVMDVGRRGRLFLREGGLKETNETKRGKQGG